MKLSWSCKFCKDSGPRNASVGTRLSLFPFNFTSCREAKKKELLPNKTSLMESHLLLLLLVVVAGPMS